jgi:hypothetical protein
MSLLEPSLAEPATSSARQPIEDEEVALWRSVNFCEPPHGEVA